MNIQLTEAQTEGIALAWIAQQHKDKAGAKKVLSTLFKSAHFATWSWLDLLQYAVTLCAKDYCVSTKWIKGELK